MAIIKGLEEGDIFYDHTYTVSSVIKDGDDYWLTPDFARSYYLVYNYYKVKEPMHPLIKEVDTGDIQYKTIDITDDKDYKYNTLRMYDLQKYQERDGRTHKEYTIKRTGLLDYFVSNYSDSYHRISYTLLSRRRRDYSTAVPEHLIPYFDALNMFKDDYMKGAYSSVDCNRDILGLPNLVNLMSGFRFSVHIEGMMETFSTSEHNTDFYDSNTNYYEYNRRGFYVPLNEQLASFEEFYETNKKKMTEEKHGNPFREVALSLMNQNAKKELDFYENSTLLVSRMEDARWNRYSGDFPRYYYINGFDHFFFAYVLKLKGILPQTPDYGESYINLQEEKQVLSQPFLPFLKREDVKKRAVND